MTSDKYTSKFKNQTYEDHETRKKNLKKFLESIDGIDRIEITSINDIYGPLLNKDLTADALAVTPQTNRTAIGINQERVNLGLKPLEILVIKMDPAEDGSLISSSRIRNGEIDRQGELYIDPSWLGKRLTLPQGLRSHLQKPFGRIMHIIPSDLSSSKIITVGDVTTEKFNKKRIGQKLSIVDFAVKRRKKFDRLEELGFIERIKTTSVNSPAGEITGELFKEILKSLADNERSVILVNGEEDLAVLPAILCASLGYEIYYGQPDEGLVQVLVNEQTKNRAKELINKFDPS